MSGKDLRRRRRAAGLSTAAAAKKVLVSRRTWVRWEREGMPARMAALLRYTWPEWWDAWSGGKQ
jgi:DNA-binding XRE family transcriptional regulator